MKLKIQLLGLIAIVAACPVAASGANGPATDATQPAVSAATDAKATADPAPLSKSAEDYLKEKAAANAAANASTVTLAANSTNAPAPDVAPAAATTTTTTTTPPATPDVAPAAATTTTTTTTTTAAPAPAAAAPAAAIQPDAPHDPSAVIPLIVMDEVPLIDAIKNLARQASLNYMLDPKITQSYGAPGPDGQIKSQPTVSLRWENLTADQALSAVLDNNNLTIIDDAKTHIARITVKDPAAPDPLVTKIIQLKYASATNMMLSAQSILLDKRSKVIADNRTSQLVVVSTDKEMSSIDELVARLDTPTKQVLIEARIVETSKNPTSAKGIDWSGTLQAQHVTFGNGTTTGTTTYSSGNTTAFATGTGTLPVGSTGVPYTAPNPVTLSTTTTTGGVTSTTISGNGTGSTYGTTAGTLLTSLVGNGGLSLNTAQGLFPATAFLNADGASAVLSFLNNNFDGTVLSTPRAVTLDNEEATLQVTTAEPIFMTTAGTQGSPGGSQVVYTNLGTILKVTPRISANNTISLKVIPEVSDIGGTITKTVGGLINQADFFDIRRIETRVLIPSGNTLVMGGLVGDNRTKGDVKVPVLGDIPFLGALFREETKTQNKKNLIIFVTPTIVQSEDFQPTETSFLKTKVPNIKGTDFGVWDNAEPQDWSKLMHAKKKQASTDDADIPTTN